MKWLKYVMLLSAVSLAAITKITLPTDFNTVANGTRANLSSNFSEIDTRSDAAFDSVDEVRGRMTGYAGDFTITSLDHLRLRLDSDGSLLGRFFISNGSTGDSLWRISEDSTWRAFGAGTGTKLTLSDSILAATARISGNGTFGGTLGVTGVSTLAALSATTGTFSSTLGVTGASTLAALSATTGSFSSTLGVTGTTTLGSTVIIGAGVQMENQQAINMKNTSGTLRSVLNVNASNNLAIGGTVDGGINFYTNLGNNAGVVSSAGAWALPSTLGVTGNLTLSALSSGRIPVVSTAGLITQDNLYWDATNDRLGIGSGASAPSYTLDARGIVGATVSRTSGSNANALILSDNVTGGQTPGYGTRLIGQSNGASTQSVIGFEVGGDGTNNQSQINFYTQNAAGGLASRLLIGSAGAVTIPGTLGVTGATSFSSTITTPLTASLPVFTNGSSQLTTNAMTGTGSVMMSASPTTTGTLTAAAITASGAVSTGALTATTATLGGGEAFTYGDTSFTLTGSTGWTTTPTGTAYATRIGRIVHLSIPYITGTGNSANTYLTGIPSGWYPTQTQYASFPVTTDNGTTTYGASSARIMTDGSIRFYPSNSLTWVGTGTKEIGFSSGYGTTITYQLQ